MEGNAFKTEVIGTQGDLWTLEDMRSHGICLLESQEIPLKRQIDPCETEHALCTQKAEAGELMGG